MTIIWISPRRRLRNGRFLRPFRRSPGVQRGPHLTPFTLGLLAVLTAIASPRAVEGQDLPARRISVSAGITHLAHQDLVHAPPVHGGVSLLAFGGAYRRDGIWSHLAEAHYSVVTSGVSPRDPIQEDGYTPPGRPHIFVRYDASYGVGRTLQGAGLGRTTVGAALRLDARASLYNLGENDFGYFSSPSLNAWAEQAFDISPTRLVRGRLMAPVASWVARSSDPAAGEAGDAGAKRGPGVMVAFLSEGETMMWNRLQRVDAVLEYTQSVSPRIEIGATYRFAFLRAEEPGPLTSYQNSLAVTTSYRLGERR